MRVLFRSRNARLLLLGETLSIFGDRALFLALGVWVKTLTGSSSLAGLVFFAFLMPSLAAPLAGYLADRLPRRHLMVTVDLATAAVVMTLVFVRSEEQLWLIYVVAALYGVSSAILSATRSALMTDALPRELWPDANGVLQAGGEGLRLLAPLVGAGLFAVWGGPAVAMIDAVTFLASALCLSAMQIRATRIVAAPQALAHELVAGVYHVARTPALRAIVSSLAAALLFVGFVETIVFSVVSEGIDKPPTFMGLMMAAQGAGAVAGGSVAAPLIRRVGDIGAIAIGLIIVAAGVGALMTPVVLVALIAMTTAGVGVAWALVGYATALQARTPSTLQGRVFGAAEMLVTIPQSASVGIGALLVAFADFRLLLLIAAIVTALSGVYLATRRIDALPSPGKTAFSHEGAS